jgi:murein DD-endopeptidase MepM/ murein hydrolase activator NlpD
VPENVTVAPRSPPTSPGPQGQGQNDERLIVLKKNETLEEALRNSGVIREQIPRILTALGSAGRNLGEGQKIKLMFDDMDGSGRIGQVARLSVYVNDNPETTVAANDAGGFQPVARLEDASKGTRQRPSTEDDDDEDEDSGGMRLYNAVYETALKQEIPRPLIAELIRIFANDVDFQRPVAASDSFEAFYEEGDDNDGRNELLYASITTRGETFRYYRFHTPDDGTLDYYDENGRSTRKFLIRKPIAIGEQRSTFGMRRHPILRYTRMHTGVDWSGPIGTPIFAAGNGVVTKAARESGYGNRVEIQHANGYVTTYNHLSGFARGISDGARVRQGQVIGFLGMTGLATGPHLHYEVMVNGHFVDPLRVRLARTRELDNRMLANFKRERDRIESIMAKAPNATRVAAARTDTRPSVQR